VLVPGRAIEWGRLLRHNAYVPDPNDLVGCFVVEVGERQVWPFITFCDNRPTPSREVRLYVDTAYSVTDPGEGRSTEGSVPALLELNNLGVAGVDTEGESLVVRFSEGPQLIISNDVQPWTTHDVWWLSPWTT
jgi:hypothetical protein